MTRFQILLVLSACLTLVPALAALGADKVKAGAAPAPTAQEAQAFAEAAEKRLAGLAEEAQRAAWVQETHITHDTEILGALASERVTAAGVEIAKQAARFNGLELPYDVRRKLEILKRGLVLPAPSDPALGSELARLAASLNSRFGSGKYCKPNGECLTLDVMERMMWEGRDPAELQDIWVGWRTVSPPMRPEFERLVQISNQGARELGYPDVGALWRSAYDMPPDDFGAELDRLWGQVKPLYDALHCHVRAKLGEHYGTKLVPPDRPIPAHLLGNMWAQDWQGIYSLVGPADADPGFDLTAALRAAKYDEKEMVRSGERFFTSLGFDPLPQTFWERSMFVRPPDREVICHASAWDIDAEDDLRIKMCIGIDEEDFSTIHHELGHNFYQRAYKHQPHLYRDSANDGFHEAVGDTVALSVTPKYLKDIGLIPNEPDPSKDLGLLMQRALDKVAFLPFGLLIDQWRWKVFSGEIKPADYNRSWWELVRKYQGIEPPVARSEADFDPGSKFHVPGNVPYTRYFLADILQFQFHRALCATAGCQGPLHRGSIYGNKAAGEKLEKMLAMGSSRPWPEALEALSGERQMDATAILDYFAPLKTWLDEQNRGRVCGW